MILDSSAIIALFRKEPGHQDLHEAMKSASMLAIGAPTLFETGMVLLGRFGEGGQALLLRFLEDWEVEVVPFGGQHWWVALTAFARYGKGRHRAALNYGDCMTYATARVAEMPLLFVGEDFARTDVVPA